MTFQAESLLLRQTPLLGDFQGKASEPDTFIYWCSLKVVKMANALVSFVKETVSKEDHVQYKKALETNFNQYGLVQEQSGSFFSTCSPQGLFYPYRGNNVQMLHVSSRHGDSSYQSYAIFSDDSQLVDSIENDIRATHERLGYKTLNSILNQ